MISWAWLIFAYFAGVASCVVGLVCFMRWCDKQCEKELKRLRGAEDG